ncbi:hypothetical protein [Azospirillum argentinense]|uniref:hypothetical protein n=1 Tax=Azospirillum argentinense TaxID=2970906 RepID=UPI0032DF8122
MRYALLNSNNVLMSIVEADDERELPPPQPEHWWSASCVVLPDHDPRTQVLRGPEDVLVEQPDGSSVFEQRFTIHARQLDDVQAEVVAAIKAEAARRILAIAPEWKQRNVTARAAELALQHPGTRGEDLPEPERTEWREGQALWDRIKAVRSASNAAEEAARAAGTAGEAWAALDAFSASS